MINLNEIYKLAGMLEESGIPHELLDSLDGKTIKLPNEASWKKRGISVSCNSLSMGGKDGKLEIWEYGINPVGGANALYAYKVIRDGGFSREKVFNS